ncbi:hypothetical protein ACH4GK_17615 [Streptomyces rimosus]|uniref:DUF6197 family protein n=1 Tax=Streptomyces rimosus TaxID=1927 RepID=UPI00051946CA|nr:hypothetical protein [Streptomyces rimosus]
MTRTVFAEAAETIVRNGHCKDDYYDTTAVAETPQESPVCLVGALSLHLFGTPLPPWMPGDEPSELETYAVRVAGHLGLPVEDMRDGAQVAVSNWNDAEERTADEVIAALRALAESGER